MNPEQKLAGFSAPRTTPPPGPELSHAGQWSLEEFTTALRTGVRPDGVQVGDWMPWKHLRHLTDEQLRAVHEYLKTVAP